MKKFHVVVSEEAASDIDNLFDFIVTEYKSELTATRYINGLERTIQSLSQSPEIYRLQTASFFMQFDSKVRRINYKKMAIIYSVYGHYVYIQRIVASSTIPEI
ncbi:MAG: type II toxin-antitoxin system RelE/ParE family toxin [Petrimonas sp.]|nr:type II toxin-antitoxin system RelE/ParE family toxin [Petrimonas sp.]MEA5062810.1 type II toxin-antitoxin system RelE/ParE family toxin [Petrimonas sp.]